MFFFSNSNFDFFSVFFQIFRLCHKFIMSLSPTTVVTSGSLDMKNFVVIVAATAASFGIGRLGELPWKLPGDMALFKKLTTTSRHVSKKNAVIMGRKTWESLPKKFRPLPQVYSKIY